MGRRPLALLALALIAAAVLYAPGLGRGLVNYEDPWLVRDNYVVQRASLASVHTIFFDLDSPARFALAPEYLPVRDLSVMADFAIWGDWYPGFHLTNLVLYLAAIALWFAALRAWGLDGMVVGVAMLLWALHPVHAESVAWVSERKGLLGAVFAAVSVLGYARFRAGGRAAWVALAVVAAVLAVWSKAQAAFGVGSIAALELVLPALRVSGRRSVAGLGAIAIAGAAAFVPVLVMAKHSAVVGFGTYAGGDRVTTVLGVLGFYGRLAAISLPNAIAYPISASGPSAVDLILGAIMLVALIAVLAVPRRGWWAPPPAVRAGAALFAVTWLPISHLIVSLEMILLADRYLLLPSLGLMLAVAAGLMAIPRPAARTALIATIAIAAGLRAFDAQAGWSSPLALWDRAVESSPDDGEAWSFYAEALADAGRPEDAAEAVAAGLARQPHNGRLLLRQGLLRMAGGDREGAEHSFAAGAEAGEPRAMSNLALLELGDHDQLDAIRWAQRAAVVNPQSAHAQQTWGKVALAADRPADALAAFQRAAAIDPTHPVHHYNIALALLALQRPADALPELAIAAHDPALGQAGAAATAEAHRRLGAPP